MIADVRGNRRAEGLLTPAMPDPLLIATDLQIAAGGRTLLNGVSLALAEGELLAVTGPSGCGKTSLLRAIAGLDDAAGGTVRLRGRSPEEHGWPMFRRHVVFLHQRPVMLDTSVEENLRRPLRCRTVQRQFDHPRAAALLAEMGLPADCLTQQARTLSIGEQQRVALARALLIEPEVLLLDEPTSALDADTRDVLEELAEREIRVHHRSAIIVTHDAEQARRLCDRHLDLRPHMATGGTGNGR
jgi:putative ABC transport system ATP-binding protein